MSTANYIRELESWQNKLANLRQENAMLIFRLSELVDKSVLSDFLKKAEFFHNEFLANDESIRLILDTVKHQYSKIKSGKITLNETTEKRSQLIQTIKKFENRFASLNQQFNKDMLSAVAT